MPVPGEVTNPEAFLTGEVTFESGGVALEAYLARPRSDGLYPGVIIIHGVVGLVEHFRDLARRFANAGFIALAPNLYSRVGSPDPRDMQGVFAKAAQLADSQVVQDLEAGADFLRSQEGANGKVGCIGFSMGGRYTLLYAASSDKLNAAVDCWGGFITRANPQEERTATRPVPVIELVGNIQCPVLAAFGAEDQSPSPEEAELLRTRLEQAGKLAIVKVFDNAGHNFLLDTDPNSYRDGPAHELWAMVTGFFREYLHESLGDAPAAAG